MEKDRLTDIVMKNLTRGITIESKNQFKEVSEGAAKSLTDLKGNQKTKKRLSPFNKEEDRTNQRFLKMQNVDFSSEKSPNSGYLSKYLKNFYKGNVDKEKFAEYYKGMLADAYSVSFEDAHGDDVRERKGKRRLRTGSLALTIGSAICTFYSAPFAFLTAGFLLATGIFQKDVYQLNKMLKQEKKAIEQEAEISKELKNAETGMLISILEENKDKILEQLDSKRIKLETLG